MTQITVTENQVDPEIVKEIDASMDSDTKNKNAPLYTEKPLNVLVRDDAGKLVGGLFGKTIWDWFYIDTLWVDDALRGQDLGTKIMNRAEEEAANKGCIGAWLWTQSFQAPDFYKKCGYEEFTVFSDFPKGHQRIGLRKTFA